MANKEWIKKELERLRKRKEKAPTILKIKKRKLPYVQVDKRIVDDVRLSWKAKGLLMYLLSKPPDWLIYLGDLKKKAKDKKTAISSGLNELEKFCYLYKEKIRNDKGQFIGWIYWVFEEPKKNPKWKKTEIG